MTTHLTARVAWHMDGWNGKICQKPTCNTHCSGTHSYPGDTIRANRDLAWESSVAGKPCAGLKRIPPCVYSINAFGNEAITAESTPPSFFKDGTTTQWSMPAATVSVWPYEAMYDDSTTVDGKIDNYRRLELAKEFCAAITPLKSLVIFYANYSNPLSTEDQKRYPIIGLGRVKRPMDNFLYYDGTSAETKAQYGGAFIWQMNVETTWPDEGLRIPYHRYLDRPEVLERISVFPENPRICKYGARRVSDDDVLAVVERCIEVVTYLIELKDDSDNWAIRLSWLNTLIGELWHQRGLYPGLDRVLEFLKLEPLITPWRQAVMIGRATAFLADLGSWLDGTSESILDTPVGLASATVRRQWNLKLPIERRLLLDVLPRFDISRDQVTRVLGPERGDYSITADLEAIAANPYLLAEQYASDAQDDTIPVSRIDRGMFPSPELGGNFLGELDDPRRLRAFAVETLRGESRHVFLPTAEVIAKVNDRLASVPAWRRMLFTMRYIDVDRELLEEALIFRSEGGASYAYLRQSHADEREVETRLRDLTKRPTIPFTKPIPSIFWSEYLYEADSALATAASEPYRAAIAGQGEACASIFPHAVSVLCGAAGTGKTTVIKALIAGIEKANGRDARFLLLAPTGKAADRIRAKTGKDARTIHSFLAQHQWLNANRTFKPAGGRREETVTTYIIDESSMLDLGLLAALCRAINWSAVQRVIFVGDPNQLPPIGRGRVFADLIDWLRQSHPETIAELGTNLRQMENQAKGRGTGILDLAELFTRTVPNAPVDAGRAMRAEDLLKRLHDLPADGALDQDLRVLFWKTPEELQALLLKQMIADMEAETGTTQDPAEPQALWMRAYGVHDREATPRPEWHQVISPYLNEPFGTAALNERLQRDARGTDLLRYGLFDGITYFDKVIQTTNRGTSDPLYAYNPSTKENEACEVFNGEIGMAGPHGFDKAWNREQSWFRIKRLVVRYSRKAELRVAYGKAWGDLGKVLIGGKLRQIPPARPELNLDLAYAISVHKSQGSDFERVYFVLPKKKAALLSPELCYTGLTRATRHCTLLIEEDLAPILRLRRPAASHLLGVHASLFSFTPAPPGFDELRRSGFLEQYKIHHTIAHVMVRSKSEVIIATMLFKEEIPFTYEEPLYGPDGTFYLPDFTLTWRGTSYYWEHLGMLDREDYQRKWSAKAAWYARHFSGRLITTEERGDLSIQIERIIARLKEGSMPSAPNAIG